MEQEEFNSNSSGSKLTEILTYVFVCGVLLFLFIKLMFF